MGRPGTAVAALLMAGALVASIPGAAWAKTVVIAAPNASLSFANETPPVTEADGTGNGAFEIKKKKRAGKPATYKFCWSIVDWKDVDETVTSAHIHAGAANVDGGAKIVIFNDRSFSGLGGSVGPACRKIKAKLAKQIKANPQNYYCNIHSSADPDGAIRGQLVP